MVNQTVDAVSNPLVAYWNSFVEYVPQLVGAIVVLVVGLVVATIVAAIVDKALTLAEENKYTDNFLQRWNIKFTLSQFASKFAWWAVFLVFISAAVEILDVQVLTDAINSLVAYLPSVVAALVVAAVTLVGAHVVRSLVRSALDGVGISQSKALATSVYVVLLVFGLTAAVSQLGIDTTLLTANITLVLGGVIFALALAFGLGGREVAGKLVNQFYDSVKSEVHAPAKPSKKRK